MTTAACLHPHERSLEYCPRYNIKRRFWKVFQAHRNTLNSSATMIQTRWRAYRCRTVFAALRRSFLFVEAAAWSVERYWLVRSNREGMSAVLQADLGLIKLAWTMRKDDKYRNSILPARTLTGPESWTSESVLGRLKGTCVPPHQITLCPTEDRQSCHPEQPKSSLLGV